VEVRELGRAAGRERVAVVDPFGNVVELVEAG
jgi:hypothetical protein